MSTAKETPNGQPQAEISSLQQENGLDTASNADDRASAEPNDEKKGLVRVLNNLFTNSQILRRAIPRPSRTDSPVFPPVPRI